MSIFDLSGAFGLTLALAFLGVVTPGTEQGWAVAAAVSAIGVIGFAVRAMIAERKASGIAATKAASETVNRLRQIEDERAQMVRTMTEALSENTTHMLRVAVGVETQTTSINKLVSELEKRPCQVGLITSGIKPSTHNAPPAPAP